VFENRVLKKIFGSKGRVTGSGEDYPTRSFMLCTPHQNQSRDQIKKNEIHGACSTYIWDRRGSDRVSVGRREGRGPLARLRHRRVENIKMNLQNSGIERHGLNCSGSLKAQVAATF